MNHSLSLTTPHILQYCSEMDKKCTIHSLCVYYFSSHGTFSACIRTRVMETGQHTQTHTYTCIHTDGWPVLDVLFGWSLDGSVSVRLFLISLEAC